MNLYDMLLPESPYVFYDSDHGFCINTEDVFNLIEQLQLTGHWIPCSERLPKKPDGYPNCEIRRTYFLVTLKSGCVKTLAYEFDRDEWQITGSPVIAWMPLPAEYKEGREETVLEIINAQSEKHTEERMKTHACDCISRKAAIDSLRMDISIIPFAKAREYVRDAIETIYNRLEELPSVQSTAGQVNQGETVSKQAVIDAVNKNRDSVFHDSVHYEDAVYDISNLPSAQPEVLACGSGELDVPDGWHWTPCSEELPKDDERVLATTAWGDVTIAERIYHFINDIDNICWFIHDGNTNATVDDVVAWRPLPKPYEERRKVD